MEHRWSVRKPHQCSVIVDCPRGGLAAAQLRNIGIGGMFVDTGKVDLPLNTLVNVAFALGREEFCLPAMVVHRADNGTGIMFLESEPATIQTLRRALNAAMSLTPERTAVRDPRVPVESDIQKATVIASRRTA
jgi:PilZ domain